MGQILLLLLSGYGWLLEVGKKCRSAVNQKRKENSEVGFICVPSHGQ